MPRIADPLEDVQGRLLLSAYRSVYDSGRSRLRGCRQGSSVEQIVGVTQGLASPSHPSLMTRQHWLVDRLFSMTPGVAHTIVNPGFFVKTTW